MKIKVGDDLERDLRSLELLRRVLGQDVDLRVDANCAWTPAEAVEAIERMGVHRIAAVEQPVAGEDVDGLRSVSDAVSVPVIADESLRTVEEARRLAETKACGAFNIRVSKCGGLLDSMRIARIADEAGIFCVVGAQVGESGILSAAGRHAAAAIGAALSRGLRRQPAAEARPDRGARAPGPARAGARLRRPRPRRARPRGARRGDGHGRARCSRSRGSASREPDAGLSAPAPHLAEVQRREQVRRRHLDAARGAGEEAARDRRPQQGHRLRTRPRLRRGQVDRGLPVGRSDEHLRDADAVHRPRVRAARRTCSLPTTR